MFQNPYDADLAGREPKASLAEAAAAVRTICQPFDAARWRRSYASAAVVRRGPGICAGATRKHVCGYWKLPDPNGGSLFQYLRERMRSAAVSAQPLREAIVSRRSALFGPSRIGHFDSRASG